MRVLRAALAVVVMSVVALFAVAAPAQAAQFTTTLISQWNGKCLDAEANSNFNGATVQLWSCSGQNNQDWKMIELGNSFFKIVNVKFNRCLDADTGAITRDGTRVQLWDCSGRDNQKWFKLDLNQGTILENYMASDLRNDTSAAVLDANANNPNNGTNIQIWRFLGYQNQYWILGIL